jgi:outer membrane protein assembly factor BamE (lipoprotein component of BamABCDE complex)
MQLASAITFSIGISLAVILGVTKMPVFDFLQHGGPERPMKAVTTSSRPYFVAGDAQREKLIEQTKLIRIGDSREHVLSLLGTPTTEQQRSTDSIVAPKPFYELRWFFIEWEKDWGNEDKDQYVQVFLDENHVVEAIEVKIK